MPAFGYSHPGTAARHRTRCYPTKAAYTTSAEASGDAAPKVTVLIDDRDIRVLDRDTGQLIRKLVLDPPATTNHAASNAEIHPKTGSRCKPCLGTPVNDVPRHDIGRADRI